MYHVTRRVLFINVTVTQKEERIDFLSVRG